MFYASVVRADFLAEDSEQIAEYLQQGDRLEVVDIGEVKIKFETCHCYDDEDEPAEAVQGGLWQ
jgi:hypothetical protein